MAWLVKAIIRCLSAEEAVAPCGGPSRSLSPLPPGDEDSGGGGCSCVLDGRGGVLVSVSCWGASCQKRILVFLPLDMSHPFPSVPLQKFLVLFTSELVSEMACSSARVLRLGLVMSRDARRYLLLAPR